MLILDLFLTKEIIMMLIVGDDYDHYGSIS